MLSRTKQLTSVFLQTSSLFHRADAHTPSAAQPSGALPANGLVRNSGPRVCVFVHGDWLFFSTPTAHESTFLVIYNVSSVRADTDARSQRPSGAPRANEVLQFYCASSGPVPTLPRRPRTCSALPSFPPTPAFYVHPNCTVDFITCCCWTRPP